MLFKIKIFLLYLVLLVFSSNGLSQNLIVNGNFESRTSGCCSYGNPVGLPCVNNWYVASGNTPDYYHKCDPWVSSACGSCFWPTNDSAFVGFFNFSKGSDWSEYAECYFSDTLIMGHKYCLSFILLLAENALASDGLGVYFSKDFIDTTVNLLNYLTPQIQNPSGNILYDSTNWVNFSGEYIASGGELYLVVGNFKLASDTQYDTTSPYPQSYYFVDNFSLVDCTDTSSVIEPPISTFEIYPNPANEYLTVQCPDSNVTLYIFDVLGQNVKQVSTSQGKNEVSVSHLAAGVYLVRYKDLVKKIIINR